jgi:hypothetical protein
MMGQRLAASLINGRELKMSGRGLVAPLLAVLAAMVVASPAIGDGVSEQETKVLESEGLTPAQAACDLSAQGRAGNIGEELEEALGHQYGSLWFDDQTCRFKVLMPPGADEVAAQAVVKADGVASLTDYVPVKYTWAQVERKAEAVRERLKPQTSAQQASVGTSPQDDGVVVDLAANIDRATVMRVLAVVQAAQPNDTNGQQDAAKRDVAREVPVEVLPVAPSNLQVQSAIGATRTVPGQGGPALLPAIATECSFPFCNVPLRGGVENRTSSIFFKKEGVEYEEKGICTTGVLVEQTSTSNKNVPYHEKYLSTVAHCFFLANEEHPAMEEARHKPIFTDNASRSITYAFKPPPEGLPYEISHKADIGLLPMKGLTGVGAVVKWGGQEKYLIATKTLTAYVGLMECHSGAVSGSKGAQCGRVTEHNITAEIDYTAEHKGIVFEEHLDKVCALTEPGDSGGPFYTEHKGTGLTVAAYSKPCVEGGYTLANELHYALDAGPNWKMILIKS